MQLAARQKDGSTLRDHLLAAAASSGHADPLLHLPDVPAEAGALWACYGALSASRRSGMGMHAIALTDIEAWCRLNHVVLTPWEVDTLIAIDLATRAVANKKEAH